MGIEYNAGDLYFLVFYEDELLRVPSIDPVVYIGKDLKKNDEDVWYFQDASTYELYGPFIEITDFSGKEDEIEVHTFSESGVTYVKNIEGLIKEMNKCIVRRGGTAKRESREP